VRSTVDHRKFADDSVRAQKGDNTVLSLLRRNYDLYQACLDSIAAVADIAGAKQYFAVP
jgi:hypothetical protein